MLCLGIESTAHTFGAAVISDETGLDSGRAPDLHPGTNFKILFDVKDVFRPPKGSGIHPRDASRHHSDVAGQVIERALKGSGVRIDELDCIAYSAGPGLGPCLRIGAVVGRALSSYYGKPLVAANHALGHIELGKYLTGLTNPLVLLISGGHTAIAARQPEGWRIFGETLDLTLGQLLDQLGRHFGLSSPAGPQIEKLASDCSDKENLPSLPYTVKGNDVSYSGLLSASKELYSNGYSKEIVARAVQEYAFSMLTETTERALAFTDNAELLVTGGVAANQRLSSMLGKMCKDRNVKLGVIPRQYAGDCGSQIGAVGAQFFRKGMIVDPSNAFIRQSWRIDRVELQKTRG